MLLTINMWLIIYMSPCWFWPPPGWAVPRQESSFSPAPSQTGHFSKLRDQAWPGISMRGGSNPLGASLCVGSLHQDAPMSLLRNAQCAHKLLSQKWSRENMLLARQATMGKEVIDKLCKAKKKNNEQILNWVSNDNWGLCCGMYDYRKALKECKVIR